MKICIYDKKRRLLKERHVDFDNLMLEAQGKFNSDPVSAASEIIQSQFEEEGVGLSSKLLFELQKKIGKVASSGDDSLGIDIIGGVNIKPKKHTQGDRLDMNQSELFERSIEYPNIAFKEIYNSLVGLDAAKERLVKEAIFLISPEALEKWSKDKHKGKKIFAVKTVEQRSPFLIFGGDVGTGKTALAESIGNAISETIHKAVKLFRLSIMTRGGGIVGEMTKLITAAFKTIEAEANSLGFPVILLLDEADALAQSREAVQMHHEDRAGVNALIQGIDRIRMNTKTALIIFCTNRLSAIDPAVRRRAADIFEFKRPAKEQRKALFIQYLPELNLKTEEIEKLVSLTGESNNRKYAFSYSDIVNKLIPNAVFSSYPNKALTFEALKKAAQETIPTAPFMER